MSKDMSKPQLLAWGIFIVENLIFLASLISNYLYPMDPTAVPDSPIKFAIWGFMIIVVIVFQIFNGLAISKMDSGNQGWFITLIVLSLIHNPLYFIPIIWSFMTIHHQKTANSN